MPQPPEAEVLSTGNFHSSVRWGMTSAVRVNSLSLYDMNFERPGILWALLLVAIPLLVHLFRWQRFRKVDFPDIRFLEQLERESRRMRKWRQYLLLLSRILFIVFLVLAFARPRNTSTGQESRPVYLYLDATPSMAYRSGQLSFFEQARQALLHRIKEGPHWYWMTDNHAPVLYDAEELKQKIRQARVHCVTGDPRQVIRRLDATDTLSKIVYYFTDGQGMDSTFLHDLDARNSYVFFLPPGGASYQNTVVDTVFLAAGEPNGRILACVLKRYGTPARHKLEVRSGSRLLYATGVELAAGGMDTVRFTVPPGITYGQISIDSDERQPRDNILYFVLPPQTPKHILLVGRDLPRFWFKLFEAGGHQVETAVPSALPYDKGDAFDLIVFYGWDPVLSTGQIDRRFPAARKVFVPVEDTYTDRLFYRQWTGTADFERDTVTYRASGVDWNHPFFRDVVSQSPGRFRAPRVKGSYRSTGFHPAQPLIRLEDHRPYLVRRGAWYVFTGPLQAPYSDFYLSPLMTAVFYKLLQQAKPSGALYHTCQSDMTIEVPRPRSAEEPVEMRGRKVRQIPYQQQTASGLRLFPDPYMLEPGLYACVQGQDTLAMVALNIDRSESAPRPSLDTLRRWAPEHVSWKTYEAEETGLFFDRHNPWPSRIMWIALLWILFELLILKLWKN